MRIDKMTVQELIDVLSKLNNLDSQVYMEVDSYLVPIERTYIDEDADMILTDTPLN